MHDTRENLFLNPSLVYFLAGARMLSSWVLSCCVVRLRNCISSSCLRCSVCRRSASRRSISSSFRGRQDGQISGRYPFAIVLVHLAPSSRNLPHLALYFCTSASSSNLFCSSWAICKMQNYFFSNASDRDERLRNYMDNKHVPFFLGSYLDFHVRLAGLSLQRLAHTKCHAAFVQRLEGRRRNVATL